MHCALTLNCSSDSSEEPGANSDKLLLEDRADQTVRKLVGLTPLAMRSSNKTL